jgi:hypothetical protein
VTLSFDGLELEAVRELCERLQIHLSFGMLSRS